MNLTRELSYDASVDEVRAMLREPAYWDKVAAATGARSSTTTVDGDTVTTDELQEVAGVPSFAKKIVGDSTQAVKTMAWNGDSAPYRAAFSVDTPGKPTSITGTVSLAAAGGGTTMTYALEVKASVPLVGGKLEKLVAELTDAGFDKEFAVGQAWLRGER